MSSINRFHSPSFLKEEQWPGIPTPIAAQLFAMLNYFETSQWLKEEELRTKQFSQLIQLFQHATNHVPYYQDRLNSFKNINTAEELRNAWPEIPILTRKELQQAKNQIHSTKPLPSHGQTTVKSTSGSTGQPVSVLTNQVTQFFWCAILLRDHCWHQRDFTKTIANIRFSEKPDALPPYGKKFENWGVATHYVTETGPLYQLDFVAVEEQVKWLKRINPHYLMSNPSNLKSIIEYFAQSGDIPSNLQEVRTHSEIVEPSLRELIKNVLNVPCVDVYSSREIGYMALQCPLYPHYHIQSESVLIEILDENNNPCQAGETGRIVVTNLHNFSSPLIRYEIGDYAVVGEPCPCGRGLPVLKQILGRQRNMLILPNGEKRWPVFDGKYVCLVELFANLQFQLIQKTLDTVEVKLVRATPYPLDEELRLQGLIQTALEYPFKIIFNYVDEIPRSANGKFEDFKSEVA